MFSAPWTETTMSDPYLDALEQLDQMRDRAFKAEAAIQRVRGIVDADQTVPIDARDPASYVAGYADATFRVRQVLDGQR